LDRGTNARFAKLRARLCITAITAFAGIATVGVGYRIQSIPTTGYAQRLSDAACISKCASAGLVRKLTQGVDSSL
jgi:hypothetical protein